MISLSSNNTNNAQIAFNRSIEFTQAGVIEPLDGHELYHEQSLNVVIENVGELNALEVQGRLTNSDDWVVLQTIRGISGGQFGMVEIVNISKYNLIRFNVDTYKSYGSSTPKLTVSAFFNEASEADKAVEGNVNSETSLIELIAMQNKMIMQLNCNLAIIKDDIKALRMHMNEITDLENN
jgi:hypothetical protein